MPPGESPGKLYGADAIPGNWAAALMLMLKSQRSWKDPSTRPGLMSAVGGRVSGPLPCGYQIAVDTSEVREEVALKSGER